MSKWIWMLVGATLLFGGMAKKALAADPVIEMLQEKGVITADEAQKLYDQKAKAEPVLSANAISKLTIKGRIFAGYFLSDEPTKNASLYSNYGSGSNKNYNNGSFEVPEAKLQFNWNPMDRLGVVARLSFGNADNGNLKFDYLYAQYNGIIPGDLKSRLRLGKIKVDFGEETWTNNPVENNVGLISNSAFNTNGYDEGIELYGNFIPGKFGYTLSVTNGNSGTGIDNNTNKAIAAKLFVQPLDTTAANLYFSGSYYTAGLPDSASKTDFTIAGLGTGTAANWTRDLWEVDAKSTLFRQDSAGNKTERARLAAAYGQFSDNFDHTPTSNDRNGAYYFLESMYNFTPKIYAGARYSIVTLDKKYADTMNGIANANEYERTSVGVGYRLNNLVTLKAEYSWNDTSRMTGTTTGVKAKSLSDNLFAVGLASAF